MDALAELSGGAVSRPSVVRLHYPDRTRSFLGFRELPQFQRYLWLIYAGWSSPVDDFKASLERSLPAGATCYGSFHPSNLSSVEGVGAPYVNVLVDFAGAGRFDTRLEMLSVGGCRPRVALPSGETDELLLSSLLLIQRYSVEREGCFATFGERLVEGVAEKPTSVPSDEEKAKEIEAEFKRA